MGKKINANNLAADVAAVEGGVISISIAQVKETQRLTFQRLAKLYKPSQVLELIERYQ